MSNRLRMTRAEKDALAETIRRMFCYRESKEPEKPTVDTVPVVHGRWLDLNGNDVGWVHDKYPADSCYCSVCKEWLNGSDEYNVIGLYCPNCGAKMDEKEK